MIYHCARRQPYERTLCETTNWVSPIFLITRIKMGAIIESRANRAWMLESRRSRVRTLTYLFKLSLSKGLN